jgi:hypothetical protein
VPTEPLGPVEWSPSRRVDRGRDARPSRSRPSWFPPPRSRASTVSQSLRTPQSVAAGVIAHAADLVVGRAVLAVRTMRSNARIRGERPSPSFLENLRSNSSSVNASVFSLRSVETIVAWPRTPSKVMTALCRLIRFTSTSRVGTETTSFASTVAAPACAGAVDSKRRQRGQPERARRRHAPLIGSSEDRL